MRNILEMRGVEPRTFRMQSGRATTVPHPHITLSAGSQILYLTK